MAVSNTPTELSNKYGKGVGVVQGIESDGPNPEEKIRLSGETKSFYKKYDDGTITVQTLVDNSGSIDISKEVINNDLDWDLL